MLKVIGGEQEGEFKAVASGTLPNGKPVVVNADGTVSVVGESSVSQEVGTEAIFTTSPQPAFNATVFDSSNNKIVIIYRDNGGGFGYGTAIVGTVSGSTISFGTPVVFESDDTRSITATFDSSNNKVVIFYADWGNGEYPTSVVGTVSGTSISFGSPVVVSSIESKYLASTFDTTNNKVVFTVVEGLFTADLRCYVGTVSGTSISFGSSTTIASVNAQYGPQGLIFDSANNSVVVAYKDQSNSDYGTAAVGIVSGTSTSFGSPVVFKSSSINSPVMAFDSNSGKVGIFFRDSSNQGIGVVGTVSGTSISFGSEATFNSATTVYPTAAYDSNVGKITVAYRDGGNSNYGTAVTATISGTSISFSSASVYNNTGSTNEINSVFDSNAGKVVIAYRDDANSNYGAAITFQNAGSVSNLTEENYIGMSSGVVDSVAEELGTATVFESGLSQYISAAYDTNSNKIVIAYQDNTNSQYGTAVVGTISGTSVSFGTPVVFEASTTSNCSISFDSNTNKVVIAYSNSSFYGTAVVGTVSGTSISFGTPVVFESASSSYISNVYDESAQKVVISYSDIGNSRYGTSIVGTVSGTSISFGSPVIFEGSTRADDISSTYDANAQKIVIGYGQNFTSGRAIVGTVSGTSISFGSSVEFFSGNTSFLSTSLVYDSTAQKVIIAYSDYSNSQYGTAIVGTVSGTSISFGSATVFEAAATSYIATSYNPFSDKTVISYTDSGNSNYATATIGTISGTSISFETPFLVNSSASFWGASTYDPDNNTIALLYRDGGNSGAGTARIYQTGSVTRGSVADTNPASIDIIGSVSDNQLSLTAGEKYYVQTDGTISTTAGSPSVLAGTAISATKLVVKT